MKLNSLLFSILLLISFSAAAKSTSFHQSSNEFKKGLGQLKNVEDGGYPFVTLTIELAEGGTGIYTVNLEEVKTVNAKTLSDWIGKEVGFNYQTTLDNALLDLKQNGKSLFGDEQELPADIKKISGILKGAKTATAGDVPDQISITDKNNNAKVFDFFITESMVAANGKNVVGYYEERSHSVITSIQVTDDLAGQIINETGLIKETDDLGFPMAYVLVEFPERKTQEEFYINLSEVKNVDMNTLRKWTGRYIQFGYISEPENAMIDIRQNDRSLFSDVNKKLPSKVKKVIGELSGAIEPSQGDFLEQITITTKNNEKYNFSFFITPEMVAVNGQNVVGYYEERFKHTIKKIKVLPK